MFKNVCGNSHVLDLQPGPMRGGLSRYIDLGPGDPRRGCESLKGSIACHIIYLDFFYVISTQILNYERSPRTPKQSCSVL